MTYTKAEWDISEQRREAHLAAPRDQPEEEDGTEAQQHDHSHGEKARGQQDGTQRAQGVGTPGGPPRAPGAAETQAAGF